MQPYPRIGRDDEDHIANLRADLRQAVRYGDTDQARLLRAQIAAIRDELWLDFQQRFDTATFAAGEDRIAPNVTYTSSHR
jgi:hypothetical protein